MNLSLYNSTKLLNDLENLLINLSEPLPTKVKPRVLPGG